MAIGQGVAACSRAGNGLRRHKDRHRQGHPPVGYMLENALVAGILLHGGDVHAGGAHAHAGHSLSSPRNMRADAGIVISASHNPYQDNGIKVFGRDGYKLPDAVEAEVERYALADAEAAMDATTAGRPRRPRRDGPGPAHRRRPGPLHRFPEKLLPPPELHLDGISPMAVDCAHGATYKVAPAVFSELGADLELMGDEPQRHQHQRRGGRPAPGNGLAQRVRRVAAGGPRWAWPLTATATG